MLASIIEIDGNKPILVGVEADNPEEEFKEGKVDEQTALTFLMKADRVLSLNLVNERLIEIEQLKDTYMAKLLPLSNKSLLVVGGQSTKQ